jgi:glutamate synthase domain-containing protein 2
METIFSNAEGMILFLDKLRQLSEKRPIGISISICNKKEFYEICYAIRKTEMIPDFIIVEGCDNNRNIALSEFKDHINMPLYEALLFVSRTLEKYGLNKEIKIIAAGNIRSGFEVLKLFALGANAICVQSTPFQIDKSRINDSIQTYSLAHKLYGQHSELIRNTVGMMKTCGYKNINDITLASFFQCMNIFESKRSDEIYQIDPKIVSIKKRTYNLKSNEIPPAMSSKANRIHKQMTS